MLIAEFQENRWKKKGISIVPMVFPVGLTGNFSVIVSIYAADGSVAVCTGGVECGQGINTKVFTFLENPLKSLLFHW